MAYLNNIIDNFYENINNFGTNPFVLLVLILIIIFYYVIFSFLGNSNNESGTKSGSFVLFETLLLAIAIILIFINGLAYFFNINIITEIRNLYSKNPEIEIKTTKKDTSDNDLSFNDFLTNKPDKEAYHIPGSNFTYNDARAVCKAFNSDLATFKQLQEAQKKGASWCSYGWSQDQLALYPTSDFNWKKLQETSDQKYSCGLPGINGSYLDNPYVKLGANCYGVKPYKSKLEVDLLGDDHNIPKSEKEILFNERVKYWKNRLGNILVYPFNNKNWYMVANRKEFADVSNISINDISNNEPGTDSILLQ